MRISLDKSSSYGKGQMNKRDKLCDYFFNHFEVPSTFTFRDVFNAGFDAAISEVLKGIAREQDYREYRVDKSGDQGGQKGAKLDWFATWRNWVRNQKASIKTKQDKGNEAFHQLTGGMLKPRVIVDDSVFPSITNTIDMEQANARLR